MICIESVRNSLNCLVKMAVIYACRLNMADPSYMKMYHAEVAAFEDRLRKRGKVKRDAALEELEAEEKKKRIEAAPGGLDPQEVYESLPKEMKDAFDSQEVSKLQEVATSMDQEVLSVLGPLKIG